MTHPYLTRAPGPRVLAHRGLDRGSGVENSREAFRTAVDAGIHFLESDCHVTSDGVVVLFHDESLMRVAGIDRLVAETSLRELSSIMDEHGGLLTLEDALAEFPDSAWNLDVKVQAAAEPVGRLVARDADRVLVTSFSDSRRREALAAAAAHGAHPATSAGSATLARLLGALAVRWTRGVRAALEGVDALQIPERHRGVRVLSPRLIDAAHANDVEVHVWTINDPDDMRRLLAMGVDGLVSDRADEALVAVAEHTGRNPLTG